MSNVLTKQNADTVFVPFQLFTGQILKIIDKIWISVIEQILRCNNVIKYRDNADLMLILNTSTMS